MSDNGDLQDDLFQIYNDKFCSALGSDLNTSLMLTIVYDVLKDENLTDSTKKKLVSSFDQVLSLDLMDEEKKNIDSSLEKMILSKIEERASAKKQKDFSKADKIRDDLLAQGIRLIDTREGTTFEMI